MLGPRNNAISWDKCFMQMAQVIAKRSKDPNTQNGAVIVNADNVVLGMGYNGWPRNIPNDALPWDREGRLYDTKYAYVCHAEENAVYNASGPVSGSKIYCTLFPCNECAKTLIQTGIIEVIFAFDKYHDSDSCRAARRMFDLAGIKYRQFDFSL